MIPNAAPLGFGKNQLQNFNNFYAPNRNFANEEKMYQFSLNSSSNNSKGLLNSLNKREQKDSQKNNIPAREKFMFLKEVLFRSEQIRKNHINFNV